MSPWYFPLSSIWLTFTKIALLIYILPRHVFFFFCYISETEHPEWCHRQLPSKNQPVFQRQSGFSLSYSSIRRLTSRNLQSHREWGSSVQRSSCLHSQLQLSDLSPISSRLPLKPLCGIVAQSLTLPLRPRTPITFISLKDNDSCEDGFKLGSQLGDRVLTCTCRVLNVDPHHPLKKK